MVSYKALNTTVKNSPLKVNVLIIFNFKFIFFLLLEFLLAQ